MFLNNENEIIDWLLINSYNKEKDFYFTKDNEQLVVNVNIEFSLICLNESITELPIKFGIINGDLYISNSKLDNFKGFPEIINGNMECNNNNFKSSKDWNVKEVKGSINLCGENCELDNINFLKNTNFKSFILKISNTPFKNNIIDSLINKYHTIDDYSHKIITYDNFKNYIIEMNNEIIEVDDYLNSFDNQINIIDNK